jgi:tRNA threonylcarbamoyladenosine biosynthesis protein TsaB
MATILSIDTTTKACSVAIHSEGTLLALAELHSERSSSAMLTTLIQQVLETTELSFDAVDAFAVAKGPGSYTGLRIGVSTAKGLCFSLEKPLIAVNSLQAMSYEVQGIFTENTLLCPMIDARRMEVYCLVVNAKTKEIVEETSAKIMDETSFAALLESNSMLFFGDGAAKCKSLLANNKNAYFLDEVVHPSAKNLGMLAYRQWQSQAFEDIETFEPYYLKEFMATTPKKQ